VHEKTLQECRSPIILQGFRRKGKLRRVSAFMHRVGLQGVQRLKNPLESSKIKTQEELAFSYASEVPRGKEFTEEEKTKAEAFEKN
jgi:hypothetical protein